MITTSCISPSLTTPVGGPLPQGEPLGDCSLNVADHATSTLLPVLSICNVKGGKACLKSEHCSLDVDNEALKLIIDVTGVSVGVGDGVGVGVGVGDYLVGI